jgi:hypothetical protein
MRESDATVDACPVSRRTVLKSAPAAVVALLPVAAVAFPGSADSELLSTWEAYKVHNRLCDSLLDRDLTDEEWAPFNAEQERLEDLIETLPATTLQGIAIKLRRLLVEYQGSQWIETAVFNPMTPELAEKLEKADWRDAMLCRLIGDIERMDDNR